MRQPNNARNDYRLDVAEEMLVRDARWTEQQTASWKSRYNIRGGIEATMSELKRAHGLGRLRVRRLVRVIIQVALKTTACNIKRWLRAVWRPQSDSKGASEPTWWLVIVSIVEIERNEAIVIAA